MASGLHGLYNSIWSTALSYGAGYKNWSRHGCVITEPDPDALLSMCKNSGHQIKKGKGARTCSDCGARRSAKGVWSYPAPDLLIDAK